jgi:hypothetical protein
MKNVVLIMMNTPDTIRCAILRFIFQILRPFEIEVLHTRLPS